MRPRPRPRRILTSLPLCFLSMLIFAPGNRCRIATGPTTGSLADAPALPRGTTPVGEIMEPAIQ